MKKPNKLSVFHNIDTSEPTSNDLTGIDMAELGKKGFLKKRQNQEIEMKKNRLLSKIESEGFEIKLTIAMAVVSLITLISASYIVYQKNELIDQQDKVIQMLLDDLENSGNMIPIPISRADEFT